MTLYTQWLCLTVFHCVLLVFLFSNRRKDHPWLLPFFTVQWVADFIGFLLLPQGNGGLGLLSAISKTTFEWTFILLVSNSIWLTFWILPALSAEHLLNSRLSRFWRFALAFFVVAAIPVFYLRAIGVLSTSTYMTALHYIIEPFLLLWALVYLLRYFSRCFKETTTPDILALATMLTCTDNFLKLVLALKPDLMISQLFMIIFHTIYLFAFFSYYIYDHHKRREQYTAFTSAEKQSIVRKIFGVFRVPRASQDKK